jgi:hypothetical protein
VAYTFDGPNKLIILDTASLSIQDMYSRWIDWLAIGDNSKYLPAIRFVGGDPISAVKNLGVMYFMTNGWRIRPMESSHRLSVNGNLFTDPSGFSPFVDTVGAFNVTIEMSVSSLVDSTVAQLPEIQHGVYQDCVTINTVTGTTGTEYPKGTRQYPVNNLADAKQIASSRGFVNFYVVGGLTVGETESINGFTLVGTGPENTTVTLANGCTTSKTTFEDMTVQGRQSGETHYRRCDIGYLQNVHCVFDRCRLIGPMEMHQSYGDTTVLFQCYTGDIAGATTVIDLNNSPVNMSFNDFNGKIQFNNMNKATAGVVTLNMNAGKVIIDSTCTTGQIKVRGNGEVIDGSTGTVVDNDVTAKLVWQNPIEGTYTAEEVLRIIAAVMGGKVSGAGTGYEIFRDLLDTKDRVKANIDNSGNRLAINLDAT